jgi:hypothetical protein
MIKKQPKWNKYEVALLIETFINIKNRIIEREKAIVELSDLLRKYAIKNGVKIDEKYRNRSGITMKIENIKFLFSNGKEGLAKHSKLEKEIVSLYINNISAYENLLDEAKQIL